MLKHFDKNWTLWMLLLAVSFMGCGEEAVVEKSPAHPEFNKGTDLCLDAETFLREGKSAEGMEAAEKSLGHFKEALRLDPEFVVAQGAMGHAYYLLRDFKECARWYDIAIQTDSNFVPYFYERGLCLVNAGNIPKGVASIEKAVDMGNRSEILEMAGGDLIDIATLAQQMGDSLAQDGNYRKANNFHRYSIGVLMSAHELDTMNKAAAQMIVQLTTSMGDTITAGKYKMYLK